MPSMKSTGVEVGADTGTETGPHSESQAITNVADTLLKPTRAAEA